MVLLLKALVMGVVEGVTEFLPISSTGHLILVGDWIGYPEPSRVTMEIFIQMGAILAVFWQYGAELRDLAARAPQPGPARDLIAKVMLAFVPAAVVGLLFHHAIEEHLFNAASVATALVLGGVLLIVIERRPRRVTVDAVEATSWSDAFWVGVAQVASLFPGVSRAGATIVGGLLVGMSRPAATDFSFYLALPTVSAASLFSLAKDIHLLDRGDVAPLTIGFVAAYFSALLVIRSFLRFVRSHDFQGFGWYRIAFGAIVLAFLRRGG
ncbi:MAG TPA: undecaprenyl-diphosphate phosphatase [Candidatus Binatia bacterium]|nr:undecaprenyl-diphosphate phosphatase [Candidatus Binatia bacterium]